MSLQFEWDQDKSDSNRAKHGISFEEAATVFGDFASITIFDEPNSLDEDRFVTLGRSIEGRLMVVSHTDRDDRIRIISARAATTNERRQYEEGR